MATHLDHPALFTADELPGRGTRRPPESATLAPTAVTGTSVGTHPVDNPDKLALIADLWTVFGKPVADAFREACEADAAEHAGWINPNRVRARLMVNGVLAIDPRRYSALWSAACCSTGFLITTRWRVPIDGEGSRGNANKEVRLRRLADTHDRDADPTPPAGAYDPHAHRHQETSR